ncbi:DUF4407 domain-containing protein [Dactylosporangium sp. CA-152071]|uniref:DUF4407 domain-containing protein n=1 Tax=Dactylosporangium sp. CA-152071 TaxID=3239933 RepID=UPI003D91B483
MATRVWQAPKQRTGSSPENTLDLAGVAPPITTAAPAPAWRVSRNPLTRLFLWSAGVDPTLLHNRVEQYRYSATGIFLVLVASVSALMFAVFGSVIHGAFNRWLLAAAAVWFIIIFWTDRSIVADPDYGDLSDADSGDPEAKRRRFPRPGLYWLRYLFRLTIALGGAFLVTEAALLLIFAAEIQDQMAAEKVPRLTAARDPARRPETAQINTIQQQIDANNARLTTAEAKVTDANQRLAAESRGDGGSRRRGFGPVAMELQKEVKALSAARDQVQAEVTSQNAQLGQNRKALEATRQQNIDRQVTEINQNQGWIEQEAALQAFLHEHRGEPVVQAVPWALRGMFVALDLLPLSLKLFSRRTLYDRRLRADAWLEAYRLERLRQAGKDAILLTADLARVRANTIYDLAREQEQFRRSSRMNHLGPADW